MSRSAAARSRAHEQALRRRHAPPMPRRVSGPANPRVRPRPGRRQDLRGLYASPPRPLRVAASGGVAVASRVAGVALNLSASRLMDRLVRSRGWVVIVAIGLIGIVAMQVSMLKLNAGIGRAVETVSSLERSNATLRGEVSRLSAGDRIQALAGTRGFVMPAPADVTFLRAGNLRSDGYRAAQRMRPPDPSIAGPAGAAIAPDAVSELLAPSTAAGTAPATGPAAAATTAPATAPPATAPASTPPSTGGATPAIPAAQAPIPAYDSTAVAPAAAAPAASGGVAAATGQTP